MARQMKAHSLSDVYGKANLIYIRAPALVEPRKNGPGKIKANPYPKDRHLITEQPKYGPNSGRYYALLMGRALMGRSTQRLRLTRPS